MFGPLLHGTARAWRLKLDERLKPMGLSQAKWRTLLHLSVAPRRLTQSEIAARLGIEEPTLVTLLHRLERDGWVKRRHSPNDRRCKIVDLGWRAQRVIAQINRRANELRHELLANISEPELRICMRVLTQIRQRAEKESGFSRGKAGVPRKLAEQNGQNKNGRAINRVKGAHRAAHQSK
jgi:MarR family transcriptional regulator, transcriptional regulator for hemolysin